MNRIHFSIIRSMALAFSVMALVSNANAQTLTLEQCRKAALENNKDAEAARIKQQKLQYDTKAYKTMYLPKFNIIAADLFNSTNANLKINGGQLPIYSYNQATGTYLPNVNVNEDGSYTLNQYADFPSQEMKFKVGNVLLAGLTVEQPIYMGGKITAAYNMSMLGEKMASLNTKMTESEVIVATDEAYTLAIKAKEMCKVAEAYKTTLSELYKNVESAFRHGMTTKNDVMKVQVKLNEADLQIQKANNALALAKMNLCHYIGMPLDSKIDIDEKSANFDDQNIENNIVTSPLDILERPEYQLLNEKVEMAKLQTKLTKSDFMPNVALVASATYSNGMKLNNERLLNGCGAGAMITFKYPIYHFGEGTHKVNAAKTEEKLAMIEQSNLNEKMTLELTQANNNMNEAVSEIKLTQKALEQAEENMRMSKKHYDVGYETLSDYLEAQAIWQNAYAQYVEAKCNMLLMRTRLLKAAGKL